MRRVTAGAMFTWLQVIAGTARVFLQSPGNYSGNGFT